MNLFRMLLIVLMVASLGLTMRTPGAAAQSPVAGVRIQVTDIPPEDCGGPTKQASIGGKVTGPVSSDHRVVIYAAGCNGVLYVQPTVAAPFTTIADGAFSSFIHLGHTYHVLVVKSGFKPKPEIGEADIPRVGGDVIAVAKVPGKK